LRKNKFCKCILFYSLKKLLSDKLLKILNPKNCLSFVLHLCEVLSHTLKEELYLQVFKNRGSNKMFSGPKNDEGIGRFRALHKKEFK
jgi:hypothetical protein